MKLMIQIIIDLIKSSTTNICRESFSQHSGIGHHKRRIFFYQKNSVYIVLVDPNNNVLGATPVVS